MGCGTSSSESSQSFDYSSQLQVQPRSAQEERLLEQFGQLGELGLGNLEHLSQTFRQNDPYALSPESQARINQYYDTSKDRLNLEGKDYASYLAGGRGLRMSDTPVSQQALQRYGLGLADLEAQRNKSLLDYGLQGNAYNTGLGLATTQALPAGMVAAFNPLYGERMATGVQRQWGTGKTSGSQTMSPLQQVLMGTQAFNQFTGGLQNASRTGPTGMFSMFG